MKSVVILLIGALLFGAFARVARAADDKKDDKKESELQKRFEKRDKEIRSLKRSGVIGETLSDDKKAAAVVDRFLADLEADEKAKAGK